MCAMSNLFALVRRVLYGSIHDQRTETNGSECGEHDKPFLKIELFVE